MSEMIQMMVEEASAAAVAAALNDVREIVRLDGADLLLDQVDPGAVRLTLVLDEVECLDCVLPGEHMEAVVAQALADAFGPGYSVTIDDPRTGAEEVT